MKNKNKNKILIVAIICLICTILASSYGYFKKTLTQDDDNVLSTIDCLDIDFVGGNTISLVDTFPISEEDGFRTKAYRFYITNKCDEWVDLGINLESLEIEEKNLPDEYLKVNLTSGDKSLVTTKITPSLSVTPTLTEAKAAYNVYTQELRPHAKVSFDFRIWVHEDVTYVDDSINAYFEGKIVATAKYIQGPPTTANNVANVEVENGERTGAFWDYKNQINKVEFQNTLSPIANADYSFDLSENSDGKVMAYLAKDPHDDSYYNLFIQSDDRINLSEDSSYFFADFTKLLSVEGFSYVDTTAVRNMSHMFYNCEQLKNLDLQFLDTRNVLNLSSMFENCRNFGDIDISYLYLGNAERIDNMLKGSGVTKADLSNKNLDNVITMAGMFEGTTIKEINLSNVSAKKLESMANAFKDCSYLTNLYTTNFVTPSLKNMERTFYNTKFATIDLSAMSSSNITNMKETFAECNQLEKITLGNFTFAEESTMEAAFMNDVKLNQLNLDNINTTNVSNFSHLFDGLKAMLSLDVTNISTDNAKDMSYMFANLKILPNLNLSHFSTINAENMSHMFENSEKLTSLNLSNFNTSNVTDMSWMFYYCYNLQILNISNFSTPKVIDMSHMFHMASNLRTLDVSHFDTSNVTDMSYMFCSSGYGDNYQLDVSHFDTSNVTDMSYMFKSAGSIRTPSVLDVSSFDTSNVTNMTEMFTSFNNSETIDLSAFDTSNVTNMSGMFGSYRQSGNLDISSFDTSNVTNMSKMFASLSLTEGDLVFGNNFDTSNVTDMSYMFEGYRLSDLDLSILDTSNVTDMSFMFYSAIIDSLNISSFDTSSVTNMGSMFSNFGTSTSLDLTNLDVSKVSYASSMFDGTSANINIDGLIFASATSLSYFARNALNVSGSIFVDFSKFSDLSYSSWSSNLQNAFYTSTSVYPSDRKIFLNYISSTSSAVNSVINYYPPYNCLASVGQLVTAEDVGYHTISINSTAEQSYASTTTSLKNSIIYIYPNDSTNTIKSFEVNGVLVNGNSFIMPDENVTITNVEFIDYIYVTSENFPYPDNLNQVYYENTFDGASSIKIEIYYDFGSTPNDYLELYNKDGLDRRLYYSPGSPQSFTISGEYLKVVFVTDDTDNNNLGFSMRFYPIYD